jgi:hypothetical protein
MVKMAWLSEFGHMDCSRQISCTFEIKLFFYKEASEIKPTVTWRLFLLEYVPICVWIQSSTSTRTRTYHVCHVWGLFPTPI